MKVKTIVTGKKYRILQIGSHRSIVELKYTDTKESELLIMDNDQLMFLDEMGLVL